MRALLVIISMVVLAAIAAYFLGARLASIEVVSKGPILDDTKVVEFVRGFNGVR